MSIQSALSIAFSGMQANATSMQAHASNIANMRTTGAIPGGSAPDGSPAPYQPVTTDFSEQATGGVSAEIVPGRTSFTLAYDPSAPFADANGMVAAPDISPEIELTGVLMAKSAYEAAAKTAKVVDQMMGAALDILP